MTALAEALEGARDRAGRPSYATVMRRLISKLDWYAPTAETIRRYHVDMDEWKADPAVVLAMLDVYDEPLEILPAVVQERLRSLAGLCEQIMSGDPAHPSQGRPGSGKRRESASKKPAHAAHGQKYCILTTSEFRNRPLTFSALRIHSLRARKPVPHDEARLFARPRSAHN